MFNGVFRGKTVFLTGHTGFKGAWLAEWLLQLGAEVHGFSLEPPTTPSLFEQLGLKKRLHHQIGDIRDARVVHASLLRAQPDFIFHLAAQSLVRQSYREPAETWDTNVMGTIHVLNALRDLPRSCAAVFITTDKCYENREWLHSYREEDPLGGHDPYSSSKAGAEIAIASFRRSFFAQSPVRIASARAGNVIGGGDWALDRIVPDCIRALTANRPIRVRNPASTRPWQHVLEPLSGYLALAARLSRHGGQASDLTSSFNFGPTHESNRSVGDLVKEILAHWPGRSKNRREARAPHEAGLLQLSTDKARALLHWSPVWNFSEAVSETMQWYVRMKDRPSSRTARSQTIQQIERYARRARALEIPWAGVSSRS